MAGTVLKLSRALINLQTPNTVQCVVPAANLTIHRNCKYEIRNNCNIINYITGKEKNSDVTFGSSMESK